MDKQKVESLLNSLKNTKFRGSFKLGKKEIEYIEEKGLDVIRKHAEEFVEKRLAPSKLKNDGKQTPFRGHPVFIAQHATGTCCRGCLNRIHKIPMNKQLSEEEKEYIVYVIMTWINMNYSR